MNEIRRRLAAALFLVGNTSAIGAQSGSPDPGFAAIPFERWIDEGDQAHIHWTARVLPVRLSNHQRLEAAVQLVVDGNEIARRRGRGYLVILVQFKDRENHVYQTHDALDLRLAKEDAGKSNISYTPSAFVTPGDYSISLALFDTATGEHSGMRLPLHVTPLKNDTLPDLWHDLPPVEILKPTGSLDDLFLPGVKGRLHLPLETRRPVRVELLVNASSLAAGEPSRTGQVSNRSLASLIPALKVIVGADIRNGSVHVSLLDLTTQRVIFEQDAVRDLDWSKLGPALKDAGPNLIDVHALENRRQNAQFFLAQVQRRIVADAPNAAAGPLPVLIVLSGPMAFSSGEDLHPIEVGAKPEAEVFYIRYHPTPPRLVSIPFEEETALVSQTKRGRRTATYSTGHIQVAVTEPVDTLESTLKPLRPHLFDVSTPEQFRKALSSVLAAISQE